MMKATKYPSLNWKVTLSASLFLVAGSAWVARDTLAEPPRERIPSLEEGRGVKRVPVISDAAPVYLDETYEAVPMPVGHQEALPMAVDYGPLWSEYPHDHARHKAKPCECESCQSKKKSSFSKVMGKLSSGFDHLMFGKTNSNSQCDEAGCDDSCDSMGSHPVHEHHLHSLPSQGHSTGMQPLHGVLPGKAVPSKSIPGKRSPAGPHGGTIRNTDADAAPLIPLPETNVPSMEHVPHAPAGTNTVPRQPIKVPTPPAANEPTDPFQDDPISRLPGQKIKPAGYFD